MQWDIKPHQATNSSLLEVYQILILKTELSRLSQPAPTAELERTGDLVYHNVMEMVKEVVQLKNDVNTLPASEYVNVVKVSQLSTQIIFDSAS